MIQGYGYSLQLFLSYTYTYLYIFIATIELLLISATVEIKGYTGYTLPLFPCSQPPNSSLQKLSGYPFPGTLPERACLLHK